MTAEQLEKIIVRTGKSRKEFADLLGVNESTISRWITGESPISELAAHAIQYVEAREKSGKREKRKDGDST